MTHIGKIGRLSKDRRHELGQRIEDGQPGRDIVNWLNAQPDVCEILDAQFAGRSISEQNLSDWKQSGHLEWLRRQEAREAANNLLEQADDLDETTNNRDLSERFATVLASEMTRLAAALLELDTDPEKRWQRLCQIHRELSQLRRDDHRAIRITIQQQRWDLELEREEEEQEQRLNAANKNRMIDMLLEGDYKQKNAELIFGGGESGRRRAEMLYRIKCDLPMDDLLDGTCHEPGTACPPNPAPAPSRSGVSAERRQSICPQKPKPDLSKRKPRAKPKSTRRSLRPSTAQKESQASVLRPPASDFTSQSLSASSTQSTPIKANRAKKVQPTCPLPSSISHLPSSSPAPCPPASPQVSPSQTVENNATNPHHAPALRSLGEGGSRITHHAFPGPRSAGVPPEGSPGVSLGDGGSSAIPPIIPINPNQTENSVEKPAPHAPAATNTDPEKEAYNRWFRMNRGAEPFDPVELERLYAAIPPKATNPAQSA